MNANRLVAAAATMLISVTSAGAGLEVFKDYVPSKDVYNVTLVKVKPNRIDEYLAGLKQTWVDSCEVGKQLGQIVECSVLVSNNPGNADYNVLLWTRSPSAAIGDPDPERYQKFNEEFRKKLAEDKQDALVEGYEEMRTIVGDQNFRRIDFK